MRVVLHTLTMDAELFALAEEAAKHSGMTLDDFISFAVETVASAALMDPDAGEPTVEVLEA